MAGPSTHMVPMLFLALLVLLELSLAGSLGPGTSARNLPENHVDLQEPALWMSPASHHRRRGLGKKERGPGMPGQAQEGTAVSTTRQASRLPGAEELLPGQSPAGLVQDKELFLGLVLPYPEKENQSPGSERVKKRSREHKRRRERLKLHRGSWRSARGWGPAREGRGRGMGEGHTRMTKGDLRAGGGGHEGSVRTLGRYSEPPKRAGSEPPEVGRGLSKVRMTWEEEGAGRSLVVERGGEGYTAVEAPSSQ